MRWPPEHAGTIDAVAYVFQGLAEMTDVTRAILRTRKGAVMRPAKIVVGTDGSPSGTSAVRWAAGAAEREGRPLEIVVAYHWQVPGRWYGSVSDVMAAADERAGAIGTAATVEAQAAAPHVEVTTSLLLGDPAPVLLRAAGGASLLVVGNRGRGGFSGLLLGSVGVHVATHARCPVTVVRGRAENPFGPVVVGVDGSGTADVAVGLAFEQAAERDCPSAFRRSPTSRTGSARSCAGTWSSN